MVELPRVRAHICDDNYHLTYHPNAMATIPKVARFGLRRLGSAGSPLPNPYLSV